MADSQGRPNGSSPGNGALPQGIGGQDPKLNVLLQYIKDLSFESPKAPHAFLKPTKDANIEIQLQVNAQRMSETDHEVAIRIEVKASENGAAIFNVELIYAGVFRLVGLDDAQIQPVTMVEGPRLLFPFVRQIVADVTRNGGFPPLMIDPVDFFALYRRRLDELKTKQENGQEGEQREGHGESPREVAQ